MPLQRFHRFDQATELSRLHPLALEPHGPKVSVGFVQQHLTGTPCAPVDKPVPAVTMGPPITVRPPPLNDLVARLNVRASSSPTPGAVLTVYHPWSRSP